MSTKRDTALWAFWRRFYYGSGFLLFWVLVGTWAYFAHFYVPPSCFDGEQNGDETGIDCGGVCVRICASEVTPPSIRWAQSFKVVDGQYNAVAYIENQNANAAAPEVGYSFSLYDDNGLITESKGTTILPPDSVYPAFAGRVKTGGRVPTKTFLELDPIDLWVPSETGRDQFAVLNRTLTGADAQPRLEATLENTSLTEARNVEVVATIFDASGNALTSSRTFIEYFAPRTKEKVVFTWPEPIAKTVRSCEIPTDVVVAIDLSGSMNNDQDNPPQPITSVLTAAESFVGRLGAQDQAALVTFASDAFLNRSLSTDAAAARAMVKKLSIDPEEETGSTNTGDAFVRALEEFQSERHNPDARKVMVILTDGLATAPDQDPERYALEKAQELKNSGVIVYAIGLGEEVNMEFVRAVATSQENAYQALTRSQVDRIYQTITASICEDGPAVIDVVPKTDSGFQSLR